MPKWLSRLGLAILVLVLLGTGLLFAVLSQASITMTRAGVYRDLNVALPALGTITIPIYSGEGERINFGNSLVGPVVRSGADGTWSASWLCGADAISRQGSGDTLSITCDEKSRNFKVAKPTIVSAQREMPEKVAVLSDIEGNHAFLVAALREAKIIDDGNKWVFGDGHLVILGDAVDRGGDVFDTLWLLHQLAIDAQNLGGVVHLIHGNHEQYMLRGNYSRAHPEMIHALKRLGGPVESFSKDTVLGDWLRNQPVALQLGEDVFVHGGIAASTLPPDADLEALNAFSRKYWADDALHGKPSPMGEAVFGTAGITQYRGYVMDMPDLYSRANAEEVDRALARFGGKRIVIAHTVVKQISELYDGKVIAVNVNDDASRQQILMFENGAARIMDLNAKRNISAGENARSRGFDVLSLRDWSIIASIWQSGQDLSSIPHPY